MYKYRSIRQELKQDIDSKDGPWGGYVRTKGKHMVDKMLNFRSTYVNTTNAPRIKEKAAKIQQIANEARF